MRWLAPLLLGAVVVLGACSSDDAGAPPPCEGVAPEGREACLTDYYFRGYGAQPVAPCAGFTPTSMKVAGRKEIDFFLGGTSVDAFARAEGQFLQRFYETYELTFFTRNAAAPAGLAYALDASNVELARLPAQLGIPTNRDPTAEERARLDKAVGDLVFKSLRDFVARQSNPPRKSINVVVLDHIASPDVAASFSGGVIAGLGLSPTLFANIAADDASKNLFELIGLGPDFTPTLFVGHGDVVRLARSPDVIVSHELGHAMGLQHTQAQGDLMTQFSASKECLPGLTDKEIEVLKRTGTFLRSDDGAAVRGQEMHDARRLFDLRDALVRGVLAGRQR